MPTTGHVGPTLVPSTPPPTEHADHPVRAGRGPGDALTRREAAAQLERLAGDLESIADRWNASRTQTAGELDQVRAALAEAQAALGTLSGPR